MDNSCKATNREGEPCSAHPVRPSGYCMWHDPALETERAENRRRGGYARSNLARARKAVPLDALDADGIRGVIGQTVKGLMAGTIDPSVANAVANLCRVGLAANEQLSLAEMAAQLAELESRTAS